MGHAKRILASQVSNIQFITVHGLNEANTDLISTDKKTNIHYNEILIQIVTTDNWRNYYTFDKDKTCKTDGIKQYFTTG